ncbi:RrF2 family transcriptional regulator [Nocardia terpenica]|uniref:Rrf2 family transcriptional regulator n=1 Tax=Nocardia terpenica TaxID=455432 RepID=A0A6G9Z272_9NOCA|nr:Rrf2 family transcriptional regulator [Nocardia terpenica]MBF6066160.1 Rrf2 family transcriptional regulator [Nocardia terpenica]MBF6109260.1 Rrf2 family transcriptional regulator [Nocardia terpenica]MBF6116434.1 Rrf2 family transcriptional regulator [Nocardia terpenica]MBF6123561.1 Rrf2 family transcriptional regulator [Nocardia terpenica]MBF6156867.1 Rrf2 family transcriptional regulator [Nocardia terpenica]
MQLSRFTDLGLRAMMRLAVSRSGDERVTTKLIARQINASEHYVAKAVTKLSDLGLIAAQRGRAGGIVLTERGRSASVGGIVRELEGGSAVVDCHGDQPCPLAGACRWRHALADAQEAFYQELDKYTLSDLIDRHVIDVLLAPPGDQSLTIGASPLALPCSAAASTPASQGV